ncbi:MAG: SdrD B-like domain-containing protein, partial [Bacteroidota bacterium]
TVTINPNPEVSIDPDGAKICVGEDLQLTANATGMGLTYSWTASGGSFDDASSATPVYTMMMPGTYDIEVTVTDANGCEASASTTVTVEDPDAGTLTIDEDLVCLEDDMAVVSATPNGDANVPAGYETIYVLTSGTGLVIEQTSATPSFTVDAVGNYTIHTLVYDPSTLDLSIVVPGVTTGFDVNSLLVQGGGDICASLDVPGAPVEVFMRKIGDYVWKDRNRNGIQESFERPFEGATVELFSPGPDGVICTNDDVLEDMATTDVIGKYCFSCVKPGEYAVSFTINDPLYVFTQQDAGSDDTIDSDVDPNTGKVVINIDPDDGDDLTIDAGVHLKCDNLTVPGMVAENQTICSGQTPAKLTNVQFPSGGFGEIEYLWMSTNVDGPFDPNTWTPLPNSNTPDYQPGPLFERTLFIRCVRRECCDRYLESNTIVIDVFDCNPRLGNLNAAVMDQSDVMLDWENGPELDSYNYFIERSHDGTHFDVITKVSGKGDRNEDNYYDFMDENVPAGRVFYRVKRVGLGVGALAYSDVTEVFVANVKNKDLYVYPNPVKNTLNLYAIRDLQEDAIVQIMDASGQTLYTQRVAKDTKDMVLDMSSYSAGIYLIRVQEVNSKEASTVKVIKNE